MTRKYVIAVVLALGCLCFFVIFAGGQRATDNEYEKLVEMFFAKIEAGKPGEAIDFLYSNNPWVSDKAKNIEKLKSDFTKFSGLIGPYLRYELLVKESAAGRLVHAQYFVSYERQPLNFTFEFYKPGDKWMTYSFSFDDNLDDWLAEKAQLDFYHNAPHSK